MDELPPDELTQEQIWKLQREARKYGTTKAGYFKEYSALGVAKTPEEAEGCFKKDIEALKSWALNGCDPEEEDGILSPTVKRTRPLFEQVFANEDAIKSMEAEAEMNGINKCLAENVEVVIEDMNRPLSTSLSHYSRLSPKKGKEEDLKQFILELTNLDDDKKRMCQFICLASYKVMKLDEEFKDEQGESLAAFLGGGEAFHWGGPGGTVDALRYNEWRLGVGGFNMPVEDTWHEREYLPLGPERIGVSQVALIALYGEGFARKVYDNIVNESKSDERKAQQIKVLEFIREAAGENLEEIKIKMPKALEHLRNELFRTRNFNHDRVLYGVSIDKKSLEFDVEKGILRYMKRFSSHLLLDSVSAQDVARQTMEVTFSEIDGKASVLSK